MIRMGLTDSTAMGRKQDLQAKPWTAAGVSVCAGRDAKHLGSSFLHSKLYIKIDTSIRPSQITSAIICSGSLVSSRLSAGKSDRQRISSPLFQLSMCSPSNLLIYLFHHLPPALAILLSCVSPASSILSERKLLIPYDAVRTPKIKIGYSIEGRQGCKESKES